MRTVIVFALVALWLAPVHAASLRCNGDLIRPGDAVTTVLDSCGQPMREAAIVNNDGNRVGTAMYFRYDYGADRRVVLRGGKVDRVERLD